MKKYTATPPETCLCGASDWEVYQANHVVIRDTAIFWTAWVCGSCGGPTGQTNAVPVDSLEEAK